MIQILHHPSEYQRVVNAFEDQDYPLHATIQKNWDHAQVITLLGSLDSAAKLLDMGSGDGFTLQLMHHLGYTNLQGIDYMLPVRGWKAWAMSLLKPRRFNVRRQIQQGDLCATGLHAASYDAITCISVIEHGVDTAAFLTEAARLLRPGGRLLVTTDYWHDIADDATAEHRIFDLPWTIFNQKRVQQLVQQAQDVGLELVQPTDPPWQAQEPTVSYRGFDYTFLAITLQRAQR